MIGVCKYRGLTGQVPFPFWCFLFRKNVILTNVIEERLINTRDYIYEPTNSTANRQMTVRRELGQAMIPGSRLVKVEIEKSIHDDIMGRIRSHPPQHN